MGVLVVLVVTAQVTGTAEAEAEEAAATAAGAALLAVEGIVAPGPLVVGVGVAGLPTDWAPRGRSRSGPVRQAEPEGRLARASPVVSWGRAAVRERSRSRSFRDAWRAFVAQDLARGGRCIGVDHLDHRDLLRGLCCCGKSCSS